jgi:hypothetical protein
LQEIAKELLDEYLIEQESFDTSCDGYDASNARARATYSEEYGKRINEATTPEQIEEIAGELIDLLSGVRRSKVHNANGYEQSITAEGEETVRTYRLRLAEASV